LAVSSIANQNAAPRFQSAQLQKNGVSGHVHQRYICSQCPAAFGDLDRRHVNAEKREQVLAHYAEGVACAPSGT
jgi:hypothetical protein